MIRWWCHQVLTKNGDYRVFFSDDDGVIDDPGAYTRYVHKSELNFLDGNQ